jgi:hypothetical protein
MIKKAGSEVLISVMLMPVFINAQSLSQIWIDEAMNIPLVTSKMLFRNLKVYNKNLDFNVLENGEKQL